MSKKLNSTASAVMDMPPAAPGDTIIHNYGPNWFLIGLVGLLGLFGAVVGLWYAGLFLLDKVGVKNPETTLAAVIIVTLACILFLFLGSWLMGSHFDKWSAHRQAMADKEIERDRLRQIMATSMAAEYRQPGNDTRFSRLVTLIALRAYDDYFKNGPYRGNEPRPWSRRAAASVILANEHDPVGESMGARVRLWLKERAVITADDQLNIAQYPDVASVQRLLYYPILLNGASINEQEN